MHCPSCNALNSEESQYCSNCGAPLTKIDDTFTYTPPTQLPREDTLYFSPGETFGPRYKIIEEIGRGGMGRVYKAEDKELGITVALKMIHPEYSSRRHIIDRFKKETLLARSISHENVIRIHDIGEVDRIKFISMDYVKGQSLKELILTSGRLSTDTAISLTKQICEAINIANQKGIVHRDLKPQNILVDNSGKAYVTDFGVAKSVEIMEDSAPGLIIGTIQYISPEQAKGEKSDTRSDIYSLGIIMYEMLTGEKPFKAETYTGYIQKHIHEKPASPMKFNPIIPSYLEKIILKCLEKDKRDRYQNAAEILQDLEEQKVSVKPQLRRINVKKFQKIAYASALVLLIVLVAYLWIKRKPPWPLLTEDLGKSVAVMPFENNTGDENLDNWRRSLSNSLIYDLMQSKLIRVLADDKVLEILRNLNLQDAKSYTSEDLRKVAQQGRVTYILTGYYTEAEGTFLINTKLQNISTGTTLGSYKEEGKGEATFLSAVDNITPWVKSQLDFTSVEIAADPDRNIDEILTGSPQALTYYDQGKQYYQLGEYEKSNEALEQAIDIDPGFVIAYKRISENYHYLDNIDQAKDYARRARTLLDEGRVSLRERHLIEGWALTILEDSFDKAIETYEKLLQDYPNDEDGNTYLGAIYRNMEEWDLAIERFEKVLNINPGMAVDNFIFIYKAKGSYDKAMDILNDYRDIYDDSLFRSLASDIFFCEGRTELALREAEMALASAPEDENTSQIRDVGNIYHIQDDFVKAEENYRRLLEKTTPQDQLSGRFRLAHLYLTQGNYEKSRKEALAGIEIVRKSNLKSTETEFLLFLTYLNLQKKQYSEALNLLSQTEDIAHDIKLGESKLRAMQLRGLTYLGMKNRGEAKRTAEELKHWVEKTGIQKTMRCYYFLKGMIAKEEGSLSQSINDLELSFSMLPHQQGTIDEHAFYLNSLASVYYQTGNTEKAKELYEKIISLTTGRFQWGDIYAKSFYRLGKICQKKGWEGKAIEHYEKFIQLWANADPDLPETADARKQLDVLRNTSRE